MKKAFWILMVIWCGMPLMADAQKEIHPENSFMTTNWMRDSANVFEADLGLTVIDDQFFLGLRIRPEIAFGKIGVGLDIPLLFNVEDGQMRTEEFDQGIGWLRMIRYFRFGRKKRDPVYLQVGDISGTYLGYGILVNNYSNAVSFERRKVGAAFDVLVKKQFGIEGFYSDFELTSFNLLGLRPYYRPLGQTKLPIIKTLEFGGTLVADFDQTKGASYVDSEETRINSGTTRRYQHTKGGVSSFAADVGITFLNTKLIRLFAYAQYARMGRVNSDSLDRYLAADETGLTYGAGSGVNLGIAARVQLIADLLNVDARLERVWYSDNFIPQFYDILYEVDKDARILNLLEVQGLAGTFGSLRGHIFNRIHLGGSLLLPDNISGSQPGMLQLMGSAEKLADKFNFTGIYIRSGLTRLGEAIKFDEKSLVRLRMTYQLHEFFAVGVEYHWTFASLESGAFEATRHFMPYFGMSIPLNFMDKASGKNE